MADLIDFITSIVAGKDSSSQTKKGVIVERVLPERSYLKFVFPSEGSSPPLRFLLPFFENVSIQESRRPNLVTYDVLSRNGNLYTHLGSKSRKLQVRFNLTVPHIQDTIRGGNISKYIESPILENKEEDKKKFKGSFADTQTNTLDKRITPRTSQATAAQRFYESLTRDIRVSKVTESKNAQSTNLDLVLWWVNLIRASVVNNSNNPLLGPPIVRLSHGLMYNDIPCICVGYNIVNAEKGYDLKTLMPRQITVTLELEEVRMGDFGDFVPGHIIKGDNAAGWEAMISDGTMDTYVEGGW
jgi:hypothetical protein